MHARIMQPCPEVKQWPHVQLWGAHSCWSIVTSHGRGTHFFFHVTATWSVANDSHVLSCVAEEFLLTQGAVRAASQRWPVLTFASVQIFTQLSEHEASKQRPVQGCLPPQSYGLLAEPQPHPSDIQKAVALSQSIELLPPRDASEKVTGGTPVVQALKKGSVKSCTGICSKEWSCCRYNCCSNDWTVNEGSWPDGH